MSIQVTIRSALLACTLAAAAPAAMAQAQAATLTIGLSSEPTSMDPHYHQATPNDAMTSHMFETLVGQDAKMGLIPRLATSWKAVDDTTWEFTLREGVKFSNGQPFTAQDVIFTFCRVMNNEQSIGGSYPAIVQKFADVRAQDGNKLLIKTRKPYPLLPNDLTRTAMLWNGIVQHGPITFDLANKCGVTGPWPTVADFNGGRDVIGTGPYTLKSYVKGTGIELTRNDGYWGDKPAWQNVKLIPVPAAGPRLTGLLAGDFDLIENPAARDVKRISETPGFGYVITPSVRVVYFQFDVARNPSPTVKAADGKNPLQDVRVRRAISMAIDRKTITARIMDGAATPANQFLPDGMFGTLPHPPELKYDPEGAKKLLAEAGYPNGFELTISSTNDRYINDAQISQAVAQYLSRVGIKTTVDAMTRSVYFPKRAKREFSFAMGGWSSETGEASSFLQYWVTRFDKAQGLGTSNYGGYDNPEFDAVFKRALVTVDPAEREKLLQQSLTIALADLPSIPLHFESSIWAFKKGLVYEGRADQYTLAMSAKPAK
ncbi:MULTISPECIES: ABC transporter substrate-binding protein [Achromobacter]|uniref:ABC transporter substrate-binding protein n=1 Tax=Achromobacter spanius TaxID=217203 RepID=A0ABY8GQH8_9BURK|nr:MULTISPECIES: ABC transporter substrate-binding protein [Achromobacter]WAI83775.1 ABC transporter substrate-binding protein [Achromobacter spanius]WEX93856.1 ABC transporter substrate-binding protein [Achromobacter sp. SS2-2022]WFP06981.1 ABC transporter substrate-binding protein [Achromobacter spanius]